MSLAFLNTIINFLLANLFHFFVLELIGLKLYCIDPYSIKIYKNKIVFIYFIRFF